MINNFSRFASRFLISILAGAAFSSLLILLLNTSSLNILAFFLLAPGSISTGWFLGSEMGHPLAVLYLNAFCYSFVFFLILLYRRTQVDFKFWFLLLFGAVAVASLTLASLPSLNPLWPYRMTELKSKLSSIDSKLPLGTNPEDARAVLNIEKINFSEMSSTTGEVVLTRPGNTIHTRPGDLVFEARQHTDAVEYPCTYDLDIVLVFDQSGGLRQKYIQPFRLWP